MVDDPAVAADFSNVGGSAFVFEIVPMAEIIVRIVLLIHHRRDECRHDIDLR